MWNEASSGATHTNSVDPNNVGYYAQLGSDNMYTYPYAYSAYYYQQGLYTDPSVPAALYSSYQPVPNYNTPVESNVLEQQKVKDKPHAIIL